MQLESCGTRHFWDAEASKLIHEIMKHAIESLEESPLIQPTWNQLLGGLPGSGATSIGKTKSIGISLWIPSADVEVKSFSAWLSCHSTYQ